MLQLPYSQNFDKFSKFFLVFIVLFTFSTVSKAQRYLDLDGSFIYVCIETQSPVPKELVSYEADETIEAIIHDILDKTHKKQNFEIINADLPAIGTLIDKTGKKYLLYNSAYFNGIDDATLRTNLIAHAIGHLINSHRHQLPFSEDEEMDADEYAGYALRSIGVPPTALMNLLNAIQKRFPNNKISPKEHLEAIQRGFNKADAALRNAEHASYYENNVNDILKNFPRFQFPVPKQSADCSLKDWFKGYQNLEQVDNRLSKALFDAGYRSKRYFQVPGGFAVVTRVEQYDQKSCTPKSEQVRWNSKIVREDSFSISSYVKSFLFPEVGYFRLFVFVVTNQPITSKGEAIKRETAEAWLNDGANGLPDLIKQMPFTSSTDVFSLVYEFRVRDTNKEAILIPSSCQGYTHLNNARIIQCLNQR